ncbi:MAG: hypothetical protein JOZ03_08760, partial [Gammaproteobacteria bacterium]|nr:hypothetical protein [Gammaproteobacteria bacterium]
MSFILDALKKSESDRQRQSGPALFEVKVAPRRRGLPLWAFALGALLALNLAIVAWMLLRRPTTPHPDAALLAAPNAPVAAPSAGSAAGPALSAPAVNGPALSSANLPPAAAASTPPAVEEPANDDEAP